jgi:predicted MFS family arabinose efflux permease
LLAFGFAFVLIQSTVIFTAQQQLPMQRGTVMSLASFNMFVGGGCGVLINKFLLINWGYKSIFLIAALAIFVAGLLVRRLLLILTGQAKAFPR